MKTKRTAIIAAAAATFAGAMALAPLSASVSAQPDQKQVQQGPDFGQMLMTGLKNTEGCLGVDNAQYGSGKIGIIAWFENVDAAERWYYSETHKRFMNMAGANPEDRKPMQHIKDRSTPVMVMASITMGGDGPKLGFMPISQISIEMYAPLPGGAAVNGRLSPDEFPIEHFRRLDG
jgi:quinol monooxygenase YgiN